MLNKILYLPSAGKPHRIRKTPSFGCVTIDAVETARPRRDVPIRMGAVLCMLLVITCTVIPCMVFLYSSDANDTIVNGFVYILMFALPLLTIHTHPARFEVKRYTASARKYKNLSVIEYGDEIAVYSYQMWERIKNIDEAKVTKGYSLSGIHIGTWSNLPASDLKE